ncbi:uncharacterized protein BP5553_02018 [Venustampulla echinocandica]|uniref:Ubiquitin-like protease family profile domain-containing protein n=1 Tax=Venustampulla echinocandica TaxID=2656787 RepID=A0A370U2N3_9HELO|nr:uncharacterized protein BP5553_02018 [Venustampulla echinocandica]RDL42039.1 hypothetical protein BP5553_02018 [Venustampulla echinocandica]
MAYQDIFGEAGSEPLTEDDYTSLTSGGMLTDNVLRLAVLYLSPAVQPTNCVALDPSFLNQFEHRLVQYRQEFADSAPPGGDNQKDCYVLMPYLIYNGSSLHGHWVLVIAQPAPNTWTILDSLNMVYYYRNKRRLIAELVVSVLDMWWPRTLDNPAWIFEASDCTHQGVTLNCGIHTVENMFSLMSGYDPRTTYVDGTARRQEYLEFFSALDGRTTTGVRTSQPKASFPNWGPEVQMTTPPDDRNSWKPNVPQQPKVLSPSPSPGLVPTWLKPEQPKTLSHSARWAPYWKPEQPKTHPPFSKRVPPIQALSPIQAVPPIQAGSPIQVTLPLLAKPPFRAAPSILAKPPIQICPHKQAEPPKPAAAWLSPSQSIKANDGSQPTEETETSKFVAEMWRYLEENNLGLPSQASKFSSLGQNTNPEWGFQPPASSENPNPALAHGCPVCDALAPPIPWELGVHSAKCLLRRS